MVPELIAESRKQVEDHPRPQAATTGARQTAQAAEKYKVYFRDQSERWSRTQLFSPSAIQIYFPLIHHPLECAVQIKFLYLCTFLRAYISIHASMQTKTKKFSKSTMIILSDTVLVLWLFLKICKIYLSLISSDIFFL